MNKPVVCIFATDEKGGFSKNGKIPWKVPEDMAFFKKVTSETNDPKKINAVIMGRKTFESLPPASRPLPDRFNVVLTRKRFCEWEDEEMAYFCLALNSLEEAIEVCDKADDIESIFVIGGVDLLKEAFKLPQCATVFHSVVDGDFECDSSLEVPENFLPIGSYPLGKAIAYISRRG